MIINWYELFSLSIENYENNLPLWIQIYFTDLFSGRKGEAFVCLILQHIKHY